MKKGFINEAFRLQQLAGIIKEDFNVGLQKEQVGSKYIKVTGGSRGEIEDVELIIVPGDPDSYMQNEYEEQVNFRTDNGTDEDAVRMMEEFASFNKLGEVEYQMIFNEEESAAFISSDLPLVKGYMQENGYDSVESLVEYLVEEADSEEIWDFLDQIGVNEV